jgi:hypothetical protein
MAQIDPLLADLRKAVDGMVRAKVAPEIGGRIIISISQLEKILVGWDFAKFEGLVRRCRLCGKKIHHGKLMFTSFGPAHWECMKTVHDEFEPEWLTARMAD